MKSANPNLTAIQCHEIEMSMALQSILFLPCLIRLHIKHLEEPYIKKFVKSHITNTIHLHTHTHIKALK